MQLVDDHGRVMDAEYLVEADGGHLALIMESRSGSSSSRAPRNPDYNQPLTILLTRLGKLNAVLVDALVDSRHTQDLGLTEADRRLTEAPIQLALEPDPDALRRRLGTAQAKIAQAPDATKGGNATKRIRLRFSVPGFQPGDADRLAQALAARVPQSSENTPRYWWEHEPGENVWMEITRRGDIGADLNAPSAVMDAVVAADHRDHRGPRERVGRRARQGDEVCCAAAAQPVHPGVGGQLGCPGTMTFGLVPGVRTCGRIPRSV